MPFRKRDAEGLRNICDLKAADKGGMIFQPEPGIYEKVHQIDFGPRRRASCLCVGIRSRFYDRLDSLLLKMIEDLSPIKSPIVQCLFDLAT